MDLRSTKFLAVVVALYTITPALAAEKKSTPNEILGGLVMAASDAQMCGEPVLAARVQQSAGELIAFSADAPHVGPAFRKWQMRVDEWRDLQQRLTGINGTPTTPTTRELCDISVRQAKASLQRSDDYLMRLR
jgi:hypothetical protein